MIGGAGLPTMPVASAPSAKARLRPDERDPAMPASPHPSHAGPDTREPHPSRPAEGSAKQETDGDARRADGRPRADGKARDDARPAAAHRAAHATHGPHEARDDDDARNDDAFSRLLEPASADKAPAAADKPAAPAAQQEAGGKPAGAGTLPDQLLGLLAALAPVASTPTPSSGVPATAPADPAPTCDLPTATAGAQTATASPAGAAQATAMPASDKAGAANGNDALAALVPALQDKAGGTTTTATGAASATRAEAGVALLAPAHPGSATDTPSTPAFDALLHAAGTTPAPVADATRAIAGAPAPLAQPADPRSGYGDDLGGNVVWMAEQRLGHAQLHVSPDHLGPIEVRLQLDGSQVQASFLSAQPDVRHALEASLPRLRELLGQHGLQLAQTDVGQRQPDPRGPPMQRKEADGRDPANDGLTPTLPPRTRLVRGLLDEYA